MLFEVKHLKQDSEQQHKRWFCDNYFDLLIWTDNLTKKFVKFELSFQKAYAERILSWSQENGFKLKDVADEDLLWSNQQLSPVYKPEVPFCAKQLAETFRSACEMIDASISNFVYQRILGYSSAGQTELVRQETDRQQLARQIVA